MAKHVFRDGALDDILRHVCQVTIDVVGGDDASVTLLTDGSPKTLGALGDLAIAADEKQYQVAGGPCLDSAAANQVVRVADLLDEARWPAASEMAKLGARSSLSLPLPVQDEAIGALNIYAHLPNAFTDSDEALGREFASYAAVAIANAVSFSNAADAARNLRAAMESRAVIEQAKGVLMASVGCDGDGAFHLLVQQSQHENRKLREIAAEIVARRAVSERARISSLIRRRSPDSDRVRSRRTP